MNILIKLMSIVSLVIAPYIVGIDRMASASADPNCATEMSCCTGDSAMSCDDHNMAMNPNCDMTKCAHMTKEECAAMCDSMKCTPEQKAMCVEHAGICMMGADGKCEGKCTANASGHSCMTGCNHGCKTDEECKKNCGDKCKMH